MKCNKCLLEFSEKDIHESHDIPKYMGGTDRHGRHYLCKNCHDNYELEVLKVCLMNYIKNLPEKDKLQFRIWAELVRKYYFKKEDDNSTSL